MCKFVAIAQELGISVFVVVDGDGDEQKPEELDKHRRDNSCLLTLCSLDGSEPFPKEILWGESIVMWPNRIGYSVLSDFGEDVWLKAENKVRADLGLHDGLRRKNKMLISATLEQLWKEGKKSASLIKLCGAILQYAETVRI